MTACAYHHPSRIHAAQPSRAKQNIFLKCRNFDRQKSFFREYLGSYGRSDIRNAALHLMSRAVSKLYAQILDRSILTSLVTCCKVIQAHQKLFLIAHDRVGPETRKWYYSTCLLKTVSTDMHCTTNLGGVKVLT